MNRVKRFKLLVLPLLLFCLVSSVMMLLHSLQGSHLVGCGAGSSCESVMGTQWAYLAGKVPVSFLAVVTYVTLIASVLFMSNRGGEENESLDRMIWWVLLLLGGSIFGAALWFGYLQLVELGQWCKYCTATHLLGCVVALIILLFAPKGWQKVILASVLGLLASGAFAYLQVKLMPSIIYEDGEATALLPAFGEEDLPMLGPTDAEHTVTLMFDFQCIHCRALHRLLPEVLDQTQGRIRFQLCPVSLSSECNPYIPHDGVDRFAGSCTMSRLALAVWFAYPERYDEIERYLLGEGDDRRILSPEEARTHIASLIGASELETALKDPRIKAYMQKSMELFGRTSSAERGGIPKLIYRQRWLVPETDSAEELREVIQHRLFE